MKQYLDVLRDVQDNGRGKADRTGTGTRAVFGRQLRFNLVDGFPLLTTKKLFTRGIIVELLWFLSGDTNEKTLSNQNVNIWKEWAPKGPELSMRDRRLLYLHRFQGSVTFKMCPTHADLDAAGIPRHAEGSGDLGRVYGAQWRKWRYAKNFGPDPNAPMFHSQADRLEVAELDQIAKLLEDLKTNPTSRRHLVTAWNPGELDQMALPSCHCFFQFYCEELTMVERVALFSVSDYDGSDPERVRILTEVMDKNEIPRYRLSCQLYQRSADIFLGVPFNIASYALLTMMIAQCVNMVPGEFIHTFGDLHIYNNHFDQVALQLSREPRALPTMRINPDVKDLFAFKVEDFTLEGYDPHPAIKAEVSV